ncbi:MAG: hypothetical protein EBZ61_10135 [Micrococcales bacterium]|nr:hypothetical protein [Micrococcales bacterium]
MAEMLLINPGKRGTRRASKRRVVRRKNPVTAMVRRRRNPLAAMRRRRRNPMMSMVRRRRRNPIGGAMMGGYMGQIREAVVGSAGALAMDVVYGQINNFLPASLKTTPGTIGAGDAVKAVVTVALGGLLNKATRGFSAKAARASLTIQSYNIMKSFVPSSLPLGYASPALIAQGTNRVSPIRRGMNAYTSGTPLLNAYMKPGRTALLSGARQREGATRMY